MGQTLPEKHTTNAPAKGGETYDHDDDEIMSNELIKLGQSVNKQIKTQRKGKKMMFLESFHW